MHTTQHTKCIYCDSLMRARWARGSRKTMRNANVIQTKCFTFRKVQTTGAIRSPNISIHWPCTYMAWIGVEEGVVKIGLRIFNNCIYRYPLQTITYVALTTEMALINLHNTMLGFRFVYNYFHARCDARCKLYSLIWNGPKDTHLGAYAASATPAT